MARMKIVFSYHGYPMRRAGEVIADNITGDEDWQEYLAGILERYGVAATDITVLEPFADDGREFVAVRVPVGVTYTDSGDTPLESRMARFCENAVDYEEGFYCDSCYWEDLIDEQWRNM